MARKTSDKLRKERQDLLDDLKALDARIIDRAEQLCKKFPDVPLKSTLRTVHSALDAIKRIEEYNKKQSGVKQGDLFNKPEIKDFIEYEDNGDEYEEPERTEVAQILDIRLYCMHEGCNKYIKGKEGYNGMFSAETGQNCDLRNQGVRCDEHTDKEEKIN